MIYPYTLALSVLGLIIAFYIWHKKKNKEKLFCVFGKNCDKVIKSKYAKTFGIDNTIIGMLYYIFVMIISIVALLFPVISTFSLFAIGFILIVGIAVLFSLYLTCVQLFVLRELCEYCLGSTAIVIAIFVVSVVL